MLMYKIVYPHSFYMTRGNHETHSMNSMYGFEGEVLHKYSKSSTLQIVSSTVYRAFRDLFEALPLCHIIGDKIFVISQCFNLFFCFISASVDLCKKLSCNLSDVSKPFFRLGIFKKLKLWDLEILKFYKSLF